MKLNKTKEQKEKNKEKGTRIIDSLIHILRNSITSLNRKTQYIERIWCRPVQAIIRKPNTVENFIYIHESDINKIPKIGGDRIPTGHLLSSNIASTG